MRKVIFVILLINLSLYSKSNLRPYRLINADSLLVEKKNGYYYTNLLGNVHFFYGNTEFYCDNAILDEKSKITIMQGNVKVFEDTLSLFAQNSEYHRKEENIYLNNHVLIIQQLPDSSRNKFWAEHVTYSRNDSILIAQDNVKVLSEKERITARCGYLKYDLKSGYGYLFKNPYIEKKENDKIFSISAAKMEYFDNYKKIIASFNVITKFENFKIVSNYLLYFSKDEKAVVIGKPIFYSEQAFAKAKQFIFFLDKNKLKKANLTDSCKVFYSIDKADSVKQNYIFADKIQLHFNNEELINMIAINNVKTFYQQEKRDKQQDFAKNIVQGDSLYIKLDESKITSIYIKKAKNGKYFFEK